MQLVTFGKVHLTSCDFSRPKPLLLLSYLTLEGPQERRKLAALFWQGDNDKKGMQKKLGKLSVVLAQFKKEGAAEAFPDKSGLDPIPSQVACDALAFLTALDSSDLEGALELYRGPFLHDLGKSLTGLDVSSEIEDWVLERREGFAQKAQVAMLELAEKAFEAGDLKVSQSWAERAYRLPEAPAMEPAILSRLNGLLVASGSDLAEDMESEVATSLDELSSSARRVFLALALQDKANLTIVRAALGLSISELSEAREELILSGLIDADSEVLARGMARGWLEERPSERMPLMLAIARATPPEQAFSLYRAVYQTTQGFGGVGDLPRARSAYCAEAEKLMDELKFADTAEVMSELREVEALVEAEPEPEARFLEAYALERVGRFKESLALIQELPEALRNPKIVALASGLLWRTGKSAEAQGLAEVAVDSGLEWLWAKATAHNTLGYIASSDSHFREAASHFKKAASLYQAANDKNRWVGCLNNYAIELSKIAIEGSFDTVTQTEMQDTWGLAEEAFYDALIALKQIRKNDALHARILMNLGMLFRNQQDWAQAEKFYLEARDFADKAGALEIATRLNNSLGLIYSQQGHKNKAETSFLRAIDLATKAGEHFLQGLAMANLAEVRLDFDAMEIALELLEQSSNLDLLVATYRDYEKMLKGSLEQSLSENNARQAQRILNKLGELYKKQGKAKEADTAEDALNALSELTDLSGNKALLLSMLNSANEPSNSLENTLPRPR